MAASKLPLAAFVDAARGDFRPDFRSPLIDAADGSAAPSTDSRGTPRYSDPRTPAKRGTPTTGGAFADLRSIGPALARREGALLAYARGLSHWHNRHGFCGVCGAATTTSAGGHVRVCTSEPCKAEHFPRTDPAVIMLVTHGDRCLLPRSTRWPTIPMHSTLAGFVEPGESLEDAVAREVKEEVGVDVVDVRYHSSQPWPFPASIMLGFTAEARDTTITLDDEEIVSANWFDRDFLRREHHPDEFRLPRADSIARRLIQDWVDAA